MRHLVVILVLEALVLLGEAALVLSIGQDPVAAAMLTAPTSATALLGACAVLLRIVGHAIGPAIGAVVLGWRVTRWATARWCAPDAGRLPRPGATMAA